MELPNVIVVFVSLPPFSCSGGNAISSRERAVEAARHKKQATKTGIAAPAAGAPSPGANGAPKAADNRARNIPGEPDFVKVPRAVHNGMVTAHNTQKDAKIQAHKHYKQYLKEKEHCEALRGEKVILNNRNNELRVKLNESQAALRDAGKTSKNERAKDITAETRRQIKKTTFRSHKFARDDVLTSICEELYSELSKRLSFSNMSSPLSQEDYVRIYSGVVSQELSARRQYVQTRCQGVCEGKPQNFPKCHNIWRYL